MVMRYYSLRHKIIPFARGALRGEPLLEVARTGLEKEQKGAVQLHTYVRMAYECRRQGITPFMMHAEMIDPDTEAAKRISLLKSLEAFSEMARDTRDRLTLAAFATAGIAAGFLDSISRSVASGSGIDVNSPAFKFTGTSIFWIALGASAGLWITTVVHQAVWRQKILGFNNSDYMSKDGMRKGYAQMIIHHGNKAERLIAREQLIKDGEY